MADTLGGSAKASITWNLGETTSFGTTIPDNGSTEKTWTVQDGVGAGQADSRWYIRRTGLGAGATDTYDLTNLTLLVFGTNTVVSFVKVKAIFLENKGALANVIQLGNAGLNPWAGFIAGTTPYLPIPGGGFISLTDPGGGWSSVSGSAKNLRVNNSGASAVDYDLVLLGTSS